MLRWLMRAQSSVPDGDAWLSEAEREAQATLRFAPRRADWRLGRWTAKCLLSGVDSTLELAEIAILADPDGAPALHVRGVRQPDAVSLSHRDGWALAVLGSCDARIGCDLEIVEPRSAAFVADYFTRRERRLLDSAPLVDRVRWTNLMWSAKESALKLLRTGLRADTRTVDVELFGGAVRPASGENTESEWHPLCVRPVELPLLRGFWRRDGRRIATVLGWPAPECPVPAVSPRRRTPRRASALRA